MALVLVAALGAAPACAEIDAWGSYEEAALHSTTFANYDGLVSDLFASCDKQGALHLPKGYLADYTLTPRDLGVFERMMNSAKRYADIRVAAKEGYLPVANSGFSPSLGLRLGHPDLIKDGNYNLDRPDILTFVKKAGEPRFRLVGLLYVAGKTMPARNVKLDFNAKSRKKKVKGQKGEGWGSLNDVCMKVNPGSSMAILNRAETSDGCKGGTLFKQIYGLYAWPLVYNPKGLFVDKNPMVDFVDRDQKFGPICNKPAPR